jgi:hypothetical protein
MKAAPETVILVKVRCRRQQLHWQQKTFSPKQRLGPTPESYPCDDWQSTMREHWILPSIRHALRLQAWVPIFAGMTTFCIGKTGSSARGNSEIMKPSEART